MSGFIIGQDDGDSDAASMREDEVLAMESIFEDDWQTFGGYYVLRVPMRLGDEKSKTVAVIMTEDGSQMGEITAALPPIKLRVVLGEHYPLSEPPEIEIVCSWLKSDEIAAMERRLKEEHFCAGEPCLYAYYEAVKASIPDIIRDPKPGVLLDLMRFDFRAHWDRIKRHGGTCGVCFCQVKGSEVVMYGCRHVCCDSCLTSFARVHIADGSVDRLTCPAAVGCGVQILPQKMYPMLEKDEVDRWERLLLQKSLDSMEDVAYCPRCNIATIAEENCAMCSKCRFAFCSRCLEAWHGGSKCGNVAKKLQSLRKRASKYGVTAGEASLSIAAEIESLENQLKNLNFIKQSTTRCPKCGHGVEKSSGCNKMKCSVCATYFCYLCGKDITDVGYEHFRDGTSPCSGNLFDMEDILAWNAGDFRGRGRDGDFFLHPNMNDAQRAGLEINCPFCGVANLKEQRNNHMCCWNCLNYFCFLCRARLKRKGGGKHFSNSGCKQHT